MANYYLERKRAIADIDAMLDAGTPIEAVIYKICMKYGFSGKIVRERAQQLSDLDTILSKKGAKK